MKRDYEAIVNDSDTRDCADVVVVDVAGETFFALKCSFSLLLDAGGQGPSVTLVALFLRTSKRARRLVWEYFRTLTIDTVDNCVDFFVEMQQRALIRPLPHTTLRKKDPDMRQMHPCFMQVPWEPKFPHGYCRATRLLAHPSSLSNKFIALYPCIFYFHSTDRYSAGYNSEEIDRHRIIEWYLVADALCAAYDNMVLQQHRQKWDSEKLIVPHDSDLLLSSL